MDAVKEMKIGVLTASISRQAGGLFTSVRSLARGTKESGCHVKVFSINDQFSDADAVHWESIGLDLHARLGPRAFGYAPKLEKALNEAELDLIHTHGLWMYPSVAARRWASRWQRPLVISPRGMLDPWAVRNSAWKKRLAGWAFENRHLQRAACLHALSIAEYEAMRGYGLANPVAVIPNGIDVPAPEHNPDKPRWASDLPQGAQIMLFIGRLHLKKGLANLLQAWARLPLLAPGHAKSWHLVIAGWDQGGHEAELRQLANNLNLGETVHFVGAQFGAEKAASLAFASAFILPSHSEGLPMSILEAWAYRLPVLMTAECNLPEGFEAKAAVEIVADAERAAEALAAFLYLPESERLTMGNRGRQLVEERFDWSSIAAQMSAVYAWVLGRGSRPSCVRAD